MPFGQTFEPHDLIIIALLVVLEGVLSIDNALVLGLLARRLPKFLRRRALTYGLIGAFVFRVLAICLAGLLLKWEFPKLLGGLYLLWVAGKYFFYDFHQPKDEITVGPDGLPHAEHEVVPTGKLDYAHATSTHTYVFWMAVVAIELTDIAFAVDSILAAVGTVPGREKLWIVILGGMLGVVLMRFAAAIFIRLLERFPRFELSAYLLVAIIGLKLTLDYLFPQLDFHNAHTRAFWLFWIAMVLAFALGFIPVRRRPRIAEAGGHG